MACGAVHSGERFLAGTLAQLDCQAQTIGAYGYGALADPGSPVSQALASLLTVFVALFALRLLFGGQFEGRDLALDLLRVAVVLTLATSWPAWRTLGYNLVIAGPDEIFRAVGLAAGLPGASGDLASRLQRVDEGLSVLNTLGTGRLGVASGDWFQLGFARAAFLTGTIVPIALVRLSAGLLLALAPLTAGLLLFSVSRGVFVGWARALGMVFLASVAVSLVLAAELALVEPWLQDALARRSAQSEVLDLAVEALALTLGFALVALGLIAVMARVAFAMTMASTPVAVLRERLAGVRPHSPLTLEALTVASDSPSRARTVAHAVNETMLREARGSGSTAPGSERIFAPLSNAPVGPGGQTAPFSQLGSTYRRSQRRHSAASQRRDKPQ